MRDNVEVECRIHSSDQDYQCLWFCRV